MDVTVTAAEAGLSPDLLDRVERGEEVAITRDGRTIARVVPTSSARPPHDPIAVRAALAEMDRLRAEIAVRGGEPFTVEEILSFRDEGRRY